MAQLIKGNYNALMWLQDELQQSLAQALNAINRHIDNESPDGALSDCLEALHQVKGTLDMINLSGGAMLADEMQQTVIALRNHKVSSDDQAQDALVRALLLLPNYLKLLSDEFQDHPLSLLDSFNELRHARQADALDEHALFRPALTVALPDSIAPSPHRTLPPLAIDQNKLGHAFQLMLVNWLRQQEQDSLRKMRGVTHYLRLACQQEKTTLFWWAAEALIEALEHEGLPASAEVKQLLGKLVMPIKSQSEHNEAALMENYPGELLNRMLLFVAHASSHGPQVSLLKTTFNLHFFDHKQKIYGMSDNALGDAHLALLEQLDDLKTRIDHYNPDQDLDNSLLETIIQQLQSMTDTLALLAEYEASNLLHHQAEQLQGLLDDKQRPDDIILTELADVLLKVESFLQSATQSNVNDQLRNTVITECLLEMANIKETLTLVSQGQRRPDELDETEQQLTLIAGSLEMLNYPEAAMILQQTVAKIAEQDESLEQFSPARLNRLADILACCDIYMEGIQQHGHAESDYLKDAEDKLIHFDLADLDHAEPALDASASAMEQADPALAELDSLLAYTSGSLLFESEVQETEEEADDGMLSFTSEPEITTENNSDTPERDEEPVSAELTADNEQWQFAEGVDPEIAEVFIEEAHEVLAELDTLMPAWLNSNDSNGALLDIRRHFHTLKGSGRMAGAEVIGELAWGVEQVLNHVIDGTRPETEQVQQLTAEAHQVMPGLLARFTRADNSSTDQVESLHALKEACLNGQTPVASDAEELTIASDSDETIAFEHASAENSAEDNVVETSDELILIEPDSDPSLREFDLAAYQEPAETVPEEQLETSAGPFSIDTEVLTSVERYIRSKAAQESDLAQETDTLSSVEQYIQTHNQSEPDTDSVDINAYEALPHQVATTGVENYIQRMASESGVARYLRLRMFENKAAPALPASTPPATAEQKPFLPLSSVDRYLIKQRRRHLAETGVERYLARQDAHQEADSIIAEEDAELLGIFSNEASQHIADLKQGLDEIAFSRQLTKPLLRAVHSLKGCANIAGIKPMGLIATELDAVMKQHHASNSVLDSEQMQQLNQVVAGLEQMLLRLPETSHESEVQSLSAVVASLANEQDSTQPVLIDPEFLVVFLEETDELLDRYTRQLQDWHQQPQEPSVQQALGHTLYDLEQAAKQAEQKQIADIYAALARLVQQRQPDSPGLDALLEQGYEQLNQHIESLLQNKPLQAEFDFAQRVDTYLASELPSSREMPSAVADIDETEFVIPADVDPELLDAFSEEAAELLASSGQSIKSWHQQVDAENDALQLQRDLHTIKGGARLTGVSPMADLTHQVETLVLAVCDHKLPADDDFFDLLQRCQDKLSEMQEQLAGKQPIQTAFSLMEEIRLLTHGEDLNIEDRPLPEIQKVEAKGLEAFPQLPASEPSSKPAGHVEQVRVRAELLDYLSNFAGEVSISRDRVTQQHTALRQQLREMEETVSRLHDQLRKLEIETETQILFRYEDERLGQESDFDPLELDRFSMIQQLSRGLTESVIDLNDISRSMDTLVKETDAILLQQSRLNADLQEGLMATRLLPFSGVAPRLERIVRQTANELDKKAELTIHGAELELDRTILDRLMAPLEHILRNAIAHGIEAPGERLAAGKAEHGSLTLQVKREGSEMVLSISDNGRGIDVDKIRQKALSLKLISDDAMPSEEELIQLILSSGFSTADTISQVAGRGVGMDVVNNEIRSLKGRLTIQSERGQGTHFEIRLPLTLSVIQALLVRVQDEQYAVPLGSVNAGERISVRDIKLLLGTHNPQYRFNGEDYNFIPLASLLDKPLSLPGNLKQQLPMLLFRSGEMRIALLVDNIISNREIVIKTVGRQLGTISAINGATILGDGQVVFILDIPTLIETNKDVHLDNNDAINLERELSQIQESPVTAMVVDDSITMRKASGNLLKRLGFEVMTARDGIDALSQLHEHKPDIILLDVEMPRMDGFEFASIVRNDADFRHLPIIMITSRTGQKHRDRGLEIGVNAYLGKPYQEDELVAEMQKLLGRARFPEQQS
jgi:chemosensory pili system protein ChpA (sensor histidine kinase/response regulator)